MWTAETDTRLRAGGVKIAVTKVLRGTVVTPFEEFAGQVVVEGRVIKEVGRETCDVPGAEVLSLPDCFICPGFVDLHIHGANGSDFMDCDPSAFESISRFLAVHGVTSYLGTTVTSPGDALERTVELSHSILSGQCAGAATGFRGLHVEGPHVSSTRLGAQDGECALPPSASPIPELVRRFPGAIRTVTVAPELPGAESLVRTLTSMGVRVSAGHTDASFELAKEAFQWGVDRVTHLFNAMRPLHHREPGLVGAALTDRKTYVELIADGVHVHPAVLELVYRLKGPRRVCLITDSIRATGLAAGTYTLGRLMVTVDGGQARLESGALAGSVLRMDQAVRNMVSLACVPLAHAIAMASYTPARAVGLHGLVGSLEKGKSADIVVLNRELQVEMTMLCGQEVYWRNAQLKGGA
jgi:N-acetylglucosamine-6-phosphate deacetylase